MDLPSRSRLIEINPSPRPDGDRADADAGIEAP
jgi:hypothetical protein